MNIDDFDDWNRAAILSAALEYRSDFKRCYDELIHTETKLARVTAERDRLRETLEEIRECAELRGPSMRLSLNSLEHIEEIVDTTLQEDGDE